VTALACVVALGIWYLRPDLPSKPAEADEATPQVNSPVQPLGETSHHRIQPPAIPSARTPVTSGKGQCSIVLTLSCESSLDKDLEFALLRRAEWGPGYSDTTWRSAFASASEEDRQARIRTIGGAGRIEWTNVGAGDWRVGIYTPEVSIAFAESRDRFQIDEQAGYIRVKPSHPLSLSKTISFAKDEERVANITCRAFASTSLSFSLPAECQQRLDSVEIFLGHRTHVRGPDSSAVLDRERDLSVDRTADLSDPIRFDNLEPGYKQLQVHWRQLPNTLFLVRQELRPIEEGESRNEGILQIPYPGVLEVQIVNGDAEEYDVSVSGQSLAPYRYSYSASMVISAPEFARFAGAPYSKYRVSVNSSSGGSKRLKFQFSEQSTTCVVDMKDPEVDRAKSGGTRHYTVTLTNPERIPLRFGEPLKVILALPNGRELQRSITTTGKDSWPMRFTFDLPIATRSTDVVVAALTNWERPYRVFTSRSPAAGEWPVGNYAETAFSLSTGIAVHLSLLGDVNPKYSLVVRWPGSKGRPIEIVTIGKDHKAVIGSLPRGQEVLIEYRGRTQPLKVATTGELMTATLTF